MYLISRYLKFYLIVITFDHTTFPIIYRIAKKEETNSNLAFGDHYRTNERCIKNTKKNMFMYTSSSYYYNTNQAFWRGITKPTSV